MPRRDAQRRGRPVWIFGGVILMAVVVVAGGLIVTRSSPSKQDSRAGAEVNRLGSTRVPGAAPVEIVRSPSTYRAVFRSEAGRSGDRVVTTDKVWVRRPWESRLESWTGPPPGTRRLSEEVAAFGLRRSAGDDEAALVLAVPPQVAPADVRIEPVLAAGLERGLVERREVRRVAGRLCQVYRSGAFFSDTLFRTPTEEDRADSCVDEAGIVLEEVLFSGRRQILRRVAVEMVEDAPLDGDLFVPGEPTLGVRDGGGFVRRADPASRPEGEFFEAPTPPSGFTLRGRYTVIPPQPENFTDPTREGHQLAGAVDIFEREGDDFVLVDQGATLRGAEAFVVDPTNPTEDLGPHLGRGEVLLGPRGTEVRVARRGGRYLRVYGPVSVAELVSIARALEPTSGTGLVYPP